MSFPSTLNPADREKRQIYPRALVRLHLLLEDFGQPNADELLPFMEFEPIRFTVEKNDWMRADTAEIAFDFEDFPLDPRIIRGGTVELYLADAGSTDTGFWPRNDIDALRDHALFLGIIDEPETVFGENGRETRIRCRDYTAYFLDAEIERTEVTFEGLSLVQIIEGIIEEIPGARGGEKGDTSKGITVHSEAPDFFPANWHATEKVRKPRDGESPWDVIMELSWEAGLVAYVEHDRIVLREPKAVLVNAIDPDDPDVLHYMLGRDIGEFTTSRRLGRQSGINVVVTSHIPGNKEPLRSVYPPPGEKERAEKAQVSASKAAANEQETKKEINVTVTPFVVRGVTDQKQLDRIAEQAWENLRHQEFEGSLTTAEMVDSRGKSAISMRYGTDVFIDRSGSLASIITLSPEEMVSRLTGINVSLEAAQNIADGIGKDRLRALLVPFYVHRATHTFGSGDGEGYELSLEFRGRKTVDLEL